MLLFLDQLANLDKDRDGFVTKSQLEKLGIKWADVAVFDLNSMYGRE